MRIRTFVIVAVFAAAAQAQGPRFDVASIRACRADSGAGVGRKGASRGGGRSWSPVTYVMPCLPARFFINLAYVVSTAPADALNPNPVLSGGPDWIDAEQYQINAKTAAPTDRDTMNGPMLRALLEDRLHLRLHRETRDVSAYALTVADGGVKLRPSDGKSCAPRDPSNPSLPPGEKPWCGLARNSKEEHLIKTDLPGGTFSQFAQALRLSGRLIIDRTGLSSAFDLYLQYAPDGDLTGDAAAPSLETALARLGLRLERVKAPREFLIIDHIERPSGN